MNEDIKNLDLNQDGRLDADFNRDGLVSDDEVETYIKHVIHFFDKQMSGNILSLNDSDRKRYFQLMYDYSDILEKLWHKGIPIIEYIRYGDPFYSAKLDPHEGIDWDYDCEIVKQYKYWLEHQKNQ